MKKLRIIIFVIAGSIALLLGIFGIFIPGLPTTPFLLLSASLYMRSSEKLYTKLINNKYLGKYIQNYRKQKCMKLITKIYSILLMWIMISLSCLYLIDSLTVKVIVLVVGVVGTVVMGFVVRTCGGLE